MKIPDFNAELSIGKSSRQYRSPLLSRSGGGSMVSPAFAGEDLGDDFDSNESPDSDYDESASDQSEGEDLGDNDSDGGDDEMGDSDEGDSDE